ncbi:hypothetical protein [Desulfobacula sp.]|uniref:hypothetical protein n=1 Tax=Desulfobacula sp. TaxID=2593537 RepID=UPI002618CE98|nr:hypothetical protein [Desulfobacula sp.]
MKNFFKGVVFLLTIGILALPIVLVLLTIENTPLVSHHQKLSFENVKKVKTLIRDITPDHLKKRQIKDVRITEKELTLLLNYGFSQGLKLETIFSEIKLSHQMINTFITVGLPSNPVGEYVNLSVRMKNTGSSLDVDTFKAGNLTLPGVLIHPVVQFFNGLLLKVDLYHHFMENARSIKDMSITSKDLKIRYEWDPDSLDKLHESGKTFLVSRDHQERLVRYHNQLADILSTVKNPHIPLVNMIRPMFKFAARQSKLHNRPVLENTALLQVLSLYAVNRGVKHFINTDIQRQIKPAVKKRVTLHGRSDLPQHFLVSGGLAVSAGSQLANFIGLAKEVEDADGGSGFSFADLAADKAGVKMGDMAIASPEQALLFQDKMAAIKTETEFMPPIDRLPEGIMELEFKKKYTDLDSDAYTLINNEIDKRIRNCQVYR